MDRELGRDNYDLFAKRYLMKKQRRLMTTVFRYVAVVAVIVGLASLAFNKFYLSKDNLLTFSSSPDAPATMELGDGTVVWLNANSSLIYPSEFKLNERVVKLEGEVIAIDLRGEELEILEEYRSKLSDKVYNFVRSELDAIFIPNIISYPGNNLMDGFWAALDNYKLRDDDASLRNSSYMGMLQVYMRYMMMKGAKERNEEFVQPASVEDEYNMIVNFYDGKLRDAALLVYLYGSLASGNDFDTVEKLVKDYTEKYNHNEKYLKMLTDVMK